MQKNICNSLLLAALFSSCALFGNSSSPHELYSDLLRIEKIDNEIQDSLPVFYNHILMAGYLSMPSARMAPSGTTALGFASAPPFYILGLNVQPFSHLELSGNYRIVHGVPDSNFGHEGFGDHADRQANVKFALLKAKSSDLLPNFAFGIDDFHGSRLFKAYYVVATKEWPFYNVELSLGWGKKFIKGFFGGIAWSPWRKTDYAFLKHLSFIAEYDASNYKKHKLKDPGGLSVKSKFNVGLALNLRDLIYLKVASFRGNKVAASASLHYNIGDSRGFFPKVLDPPYYESPVNLEPLGPLRTEKDLAFQLAHLLCDQGFNLSGAFMTFDEKGGPSLWLTVINTRYRKENQVRKRLQDALAANVPSNIQSVIVAIEADGVLCQSYHFSAHDLLNYQKGEISEIELTALSPLEEAGHPPQAEVSQLLYHRNKDIWSFAVRPRAITFFGSVKGKLKYTFGFVAGPEGYLFNQIYYKIQTAYNIKSSLSDVSEMDRLNPSQLPQVRSDTVKYYQSNRVTLEQAFFQKSFNTGEGKYFRIATGYFEPAYGGVALEFLYFPINFNWAVGLEAAGVLKRKYEGLGFTTRVNKFKGFTPEKVHFLGYQYFLDLYYFYQPWSLELKTSLGSFLARDKGVKFELTRYFPSGARFSVWYTFTTAVDIVNGKNYHDKGIAFFIPFDFFLKKSSRSMLGYAMSEWLRDVGARAATGKRLYRTLKEERL